MKLRLLDLWQPVVSKALYSDWLPGIGYITDLYECARSKTRFYGNSTSEKSKRAASVPTVLRRQFVVRVLVDVVPPDRDVDAV